jgi:FixJ family two-component response regulator
MKRPNASSEPTVFVVDDDAHMCRALRWLVESVNLRVETFDSAEAFLRTYTAERPGCLVLDVRMPGMSGIQLLEQLRSRGILTPVIILTGHGNVRTAVRAMKAGAVDVVEKPYTDDELLELIQDAIDKDTHWRGRAAEDATIAARLDQLTTREREVLSSIVQGQANKVIAAELAITEKTVEAHRKRIMEKMQARSLAQLFNMVLRHPVG